MDSDDEIFNGVHSLEMEMYQEGFKDGEVEGIKKSKETSVKEGKSYGKQVGNHIGYYKTILDILRKYKPSKFESNSRIKKLDEKLTKILSEVDITLCYEEHFEKDQKKIQKWFKQLLSIAKIKSQSDDPKEQVEF